MVNCPNRHSPTISSDESTFTAASAASTNGDCYHAAGISNQPDGFCFDAAGNLLNDGQGHTYTYEAENRIIEVNGGQAARYTYDAGGQRIQKVTPSGTAVYLYDLVGHPITELDAFGAWTRGEVFAEGRHLATYGNGANGSSYLIQADWLGTERTRVLPTGDLFETCVSLPFGDGLSCNGSADPSPNHLTGKQRDTETNLDYFGARFYSSAMGRFITPDWASSPTAVPYAQFGDPQSLNLYAYVHNAPTMNLDADGHEDGWLDGLKKWWHSYTEPARKNTEAMHGGTPDWNEGNVRVPGGTINPNTAVTYQAQSVATGVTILSTIFSVADVTGLGGAMHGLGTGNMVEIALSMTNLGAARELAVATLVGGKVARQAVVTEFGKVEIDVIGKGGEFIEVGGAAKGANQKALSRLGVQLKRLRAAADDAGVEAHAYFETGTPEPALKVARCQLGRDKVHIFEMKPKQ